MTEATHRAIRMAEIADAPVCFVHLSCSEALEQVQAARSRQNCVYAETCPHYLTPDDSMYDQEGFEGAKYVLTPPLRDKGHQEELCEISQECLRLCLLDCLAEQPLGQSSVAVKEIPFR